VPRHLRRADPSDIRDGRGLQVRLSATIAETITSVDGVAKTAGWVWRGRPTHVEAASNEDRARQQAEIGCRSLAGALVAAKLLRKGEQPTLTQLVTLLPQLEGKEVVLRFFLKAGKTRDDNGDLKQFQEGALRTRRDRQRSRRTRSQRLLGSRNRDRTTALGPCTGLEHHFPRCSDYAAGSK
jgi:hypothetical protein